MPCTIPALSNTRRCFVIACRVSFDPSVNWAIERGSASHSFATSNSRVSSPSAAKIGAQTWRLPDARLALLRNVVFNVLHLLRPAAVIPAERLEPPVVRELIEARLRDHKQCSVCSLLESKFDQCSWFARIVRWRVRFLKGLGMRPPEGKEPLGLHLLDERLPSDVLIARVGNLAPRDLAQDERAIQLDAEPLAEFPIVCQRAPHLRRRRLQFNALFDPVARHMQPRGCILTDASEKGNLSVAPLVLALSTGAIQRVLVGNAFLEMNSGTGGVIL